jgi:hypothetical protein
MRRNFSEQYLLVLVYLTLLFGSGLIPEREKDFSPPQTEVSCKLMQAPSVS